MIVLVLGVGNVMAIGFEKAYLLQNSLNISQSEIIPTYTYKVGLLSADFSQGGLSYVIEQYYLSTDDQTYIATFSFSDTVDDDTRMEIAESVLATWTWV